MSLMSARKFSVQSETGKMLVDTLSFDVQENSILGMYGPNGAGKSSFLKAASGSRLDLQVAGEFFIGAYSRFGEMRASERIKHVLYLSSDFHTPFQMTVRDLLELGAVAGSTALWVDLKSGDRSRIADVVESLGLQEWLTREFESLSDGEKQLVMFARCLIQRPAVLICDESFSKLDLDHLFLVSRIMKEWKARGMSFIVTAHDLNFLAEISDELLILKNARALAFGKPDEVLTLQTLEALFPKVPIQVVRSPETGSIRVLY